MRDLTPFGRQEDWEDAPAGWPQIAPCEWSRRHDEYGNEIMAVAGSKPASSRRAVAIASVILLIIVWGSTFVVTKAAVNEIPPFALAVLRFLIAAVVLVPVAAARGGPKRLPRPLPLAPLASMGLTGIAIFTIGSTMPDVRFGHPRPSS